MQPLIEFIREVLLQEARVNTAKLDSLKTLEDKREFMNNSPFKQLPCGSSRCTYVISSKWVLKLAINDRGYAQNEAEIDAFTNPKSKPIFTKIQDAARDSSWLIVELVRPLKNFKEFEQLSGIRWVDAMMAMSNFTDSGPLSDEEDKDMGDDFPPETLPLMLKKYRGSIKKKEFIVALTTLADTHSLMIGDTQNITHWGKTADGRVVILDYGFTKDVAQQHYGW